MHDAERVLLPALAAAAAVATRCCLTAVAEEVHDDEEGRLWAGRVDGEGLPCPPLTGVCVHQVPIARELGQVRAWQYVVIKEN